MKFQQSATPYISLLLVLLIGIPLLNNHLENKIENQVVIIQVPATPIADHAKVDNKIATVLNRK